jgi:hypothetical protein
MTVRPVCHIGTYKTGTSSLQRFLRDHELLLAAHGYRFPHGWLRRDNHLELHLALMRSDRLSTPRSRKGEWREPGFRAALIHQIRDDLARRGQRVTTIYSGEDNSLLRYDDEIGALRRLIGDAHIVVYWRNRDDWIMSLTDQLLKAGVGLSDDPDAFNYVRADSWQLDYAARTVAWARHFTTVTAIDYDRAVAEDGSVIPSFLRGLGIDAPVDCDAPEYWMNRRGEREQRVDGNRWTNDLSFGAHPRSTGAASGGSSTVSTAGSEPRSP